MIKFKAGMFKKIGQFKGEKTIPNGKDATPVVVFGYPDKRWQGQGIDIHQDWFAICLIIGDILSQRVYHGDDRNSN